MYTPRQLRANSRDEDHIFARLLEAATGRLPTPQYCSVIDPSNGTLLHVRRHGKDSMGDKQRPAAREALLLCCEEETWYTTDLCVLRARAFNSPDLGPRGPQATVVILERAGTATEAIGAGFYCLSRATKKVAGRLVPGMRDGTVPPSHPSELEIS